VPRRKKLRPKSKMGRMPTLNSKMELIQGQRMGLETSELLGLQAAGWKEWLLPD